MSLGQFEKVSQPCQESFLCPLHLRGVRSESSSEEAFGVETWKDLKGFSSETKVPGEETEPGCYWN